MYIVRDRVTGEYDRMWALPKTSIYEVVGVEEDSPDRAFCVGCPYYNECVEPCALYHDAMNEADWPEEEI